MEDLLAFSHDLAGHPRWHRIPAEHDVSVRIAGVAQSDTRLGLWGLREADAAKREDVGKDIEVAIYVQDVGAVLLCAGTDQ